MFHAITSRTHFYRLTTTGKWRDVLSGQGAFHLGAGGNRYNVIAQPAVYTSDDPHVVLTEAAYYAALTWQKQIAQHYRPPISGPLRTTRWLWCFTITRPTYVVDVEAPVAFHLFQHPPHLLRNPCQDYFATQQLANAVLAHKDPAYPRPQPGLKAPSVRTPRAGGFAACQFVFFVILKGRKVVQPMGARVQKWKVQLEFLDDTSQPVSVHSTRVNWSQPQFQLSAPLLPGNPGLFPARPGQPPWQPNLPYPPTINFA